MRLLLCVLTTLSIVSCGGADAKKPDAKPADAFFSNCGHPGDVGNELGVGKFCAGQQDCSNTTGAPLCSSLGDSTTHFCTTTCSSMGSAGQCGTGAIECTCNSSNQCGCTPSMCLHD
jgi:hypothetical protein